MSCDVMGWDGMGWDVMGWDGARAAAAVRDGGEGAGEGVVVLSSTSSIYTRA